MKYVRAVLVLAAGSLFVAGCDSPSRVTSPQLSSPLFDKGHKGEKDDDKFEAVDVLMLDKCDPITFNAAIGPGTCLAGKPGLPFSTFIAQLTQTMNAPAWRFDESAFTVKFGTTIVAHNRGGEVHTFTRVAQFGGGVVPLLNQLSGTPIPAPECLAAPPAEFIAPGGTDTDIANAHGTLFYECCIHPWMRSTVKVK